MPLIKWSDDLSVNITKIDEQHRTFIGFINELYDARRNKVSPEAVGKLIDEILEYARVHFKTEEMYFEMYGYPETEPHKQEHDQLIARIQEFKKKYDEGSDLFLAMNLATFLNTWLNNHVIKTDRGFVGFFREKGLV